MSCFHEEKLGVGESLFTQRDADLELEMVGDQNTGVLLAQPMFVK